MPECQKITGTEVNQHSGDTLALNVPVETYIYSSHHNNELCDNILIQPPYTTAAQCYSPTMNSVPLHLSNRSNASAGVHTYKHIRGMKKHIR